ncbi:MAG: PPOX class F420-dependent oxidoreductase [Actinomycetota bacterium]
MPDIPESHRDLIEGTHTAAIVTIGPDGRPQTSAVWYLYRDGRLQVSITTDRQKYRNLVARPAVGFFVLDPSDTWRYLEIRGDATIEPDPEQAMVVAIVEKHGGDPAVYVRPENERVVVTIHPTRIVAHG